MTLSDQLEYRDPQSISEFSQDIFQSMLREEEINKISPADYLQKVQTEIKDTQRAFLLEWIIDVHRKFRLSQNACTQLNTSLINICHWKRSKTTNYILLVLRLCSFQQNMKRYIHQSSMISQLSVRINSNATKSSPWKSTFSRS